MWTGTSPCRFESDTLYDDRLIIGEKDKMNDEKITLHIVDGVWGYLSPVREYDGHTYDQQTLAQDVVLRRHVSIVTRDSGECMS